MAIPALRAVGSVVSYSGTNLTLPKPAGTLEGDLLLAFVSSDGVQTGAAWAALPPAGGGWTLLLYNTDTSDAFAATHGVYWKIAGASEPANYAFNGGGNGGTLVCAAFSGVDTAAPINVSGQQNNTASATIAIPSITTTVADALMVGYYAVRGTNGVPYTQPSGWTEVIDAKGATVNSNFGVAIIGQAVAGASGAKSATANTSSKNWGAHIALTPAVLSSPLAWTGTISSQTGTTGTAITALATSGYVSGGTSPYTYSATGLPTGLSINTSTGSITGTPSAAGTFSVTVSATDSAGTPATVSSAAFSWVISAAGVAPTVTTQPSSTSAVAGATATFTAAFSGTPTPTYQWQVSTDSGSTWTNISGAVATSYTTASLTTAANGYRYRCVATNSAGTVSTSGATLTVTASAVAPTISTSPASVTKTVGQTATFTVVAAGSAPLAYQWRRDGVNISGATSASYTTAAVTLADSGALFDVVVSNGTSPNATSAAATLTVQEATPVRPIMLVVMPLTGTFGFIP